MQMSQLHCWEGHQGQKHVTAVQSIKGVIFFPSPFDFSYFLYLGHIFIVLSHPLMADVSLQWYHPSKGTPGFRLVTLGLESVLITTNCSQACLPEFVNSV